MYKTTHYIFITVAVAILGVALFKPDLANTLTEKIINAFDKKEEASVVIGEREPLKSEPLVDSILRVIKPGKNIDTTADLNVPKNSLTIDRIIASTNKERLKMGLKPLSFNSKLVESAKIKTEDMISKEYFEHESPSGVGVSDIGTRVGYNYIVMGENLALGNFDGADDLLLAWMNSKGHRENILNPIYQEIGVYAAKGTYQGEDVWYAVQHFGTLRNVCPIIDSNLKNTIDAINADLKNRQAQIASEKAILEGPNRPEGEAYKEAVNTFNELVAEYNTRLVISQEKIKEYNLQVQAFNKCLIQYQPSH